mmetsp:Transcript_29540/g.45003  ORF Transcript_29540/g.45003 Transcript_29540/m.45003 type:complete len:91 (+) Transcript_29540:998-1270(+)
MLVDVFSNEELRSVSLSELAHKSKMTQDLSLSPDHPEGTTPKKIVLIMYQFGKKKKASPSKTEQLDETLTDEEKEEERSFESLSSTHLSD